LLTGEVQEGSRWHQAQHGYLSLPLFVRPNTIFPVGADNTRPDYDYTVGTTFRVYELADGATISRTVPNQKGEDAVTLTVSRKGAKIEATLKGSAKDIAIQFVGVKTLTGVTGGTATADAAGVIVRLAATTLIASL
ncbi:MAG TPA: alpha-xylosidase, partial [Opitutaceae bacterium]|nr:alpha-xylosidase [Opitutaceae bacterium]